jgi:hypothetical protein
MMTRSWIATGVLLFGSMGPLMGCGAESSDSGADALRPIEPVVNRAAVFYREIYDATAWLVRVPYDLARPIVIRAALKGYVADLELSDDVRARVLEHIGSPVVVDEIVPFLISLKETYAAPSDAVESFDDYFRRHFTPDEAIPGVEHSMFAWQPPAKDDAKTAAAGFQLDSEVASTLVELYDALYLRDGPVRQGPEDELFSCQRRDDLPQLRRAVERSTPTVRELLGEVRGRLELPVDVAGALDSVLEDPKRLETVTAAAIEFTDQLVCRSYRVFAGQIVRQEQLRRWLVGELAKPGAGDLFRYLDDANRERRYGVVVVVDGLQGHLMEALAKGDSEDPFVRAIASEHRRAASFRPPLAQSEPAPGQQIDFLEALATSGYRDPRYLAFFRDLYRDDGPADRLRPWGVVVAGLATTPTISVRNLPIAWTGAPVAGPGGTGIPNFHFVDRHYARDGEVTGRPYYFFGNDALRLGPLTRAAGMRSLFDRLPHRSSFACAVQYDDAAHYSIDALLNLALGETERDFAELLCVTELRERAKNEVRLHELRSELLERRDVLAAELPFWRVLSKVAQRDQRILAERVLEKIAALEQRTLPELLVYYNPWPDHFAHFKGPFSDEIIAPSGELNRLDYWLARVHEAYREAGVGPRTLFGLTGDHGLTPVFHLLNPEVAVFDALREGGTDLRVVKISSDEGEGPKLNSPFDPPSMKGWDAVVASTAGGNYMLDFFIDQESRFGQQPLYSDLVALRPIGSPEEPIDIIAEILSRLSGSLDYLVVRERASSPDAAYVRVIGMRQSERADGWVERRGDRIFYRYEGADLLDTARLSHYETLTSADRATHRSLRRRCLEEARVEEPEAWCGEAEWRLLTSYTTRPDSVVQLAHLYDIDRAGSVNLFPREGIGYNSEVPGRHAGELFHEKDAFVGFFGSPVTRGAREGRLRTAVNGSVPFAIYEYLTDTRPVPGRDGWGHPSLAEDLFPRESAESPR